ncbi:hydrophobe/amphiphile efflux-3 (HAE3) family transporter [Bacillaceae bacterium S4-13-56]
MRWFFSAISKWTTEKSRLSIILIILMTVIMVIGATKIEVRTGQDMMIPSDDPVFQDNLRFQKEFGGESIFVLLSGDKEKIISSLDEMNDIQKELNNNPLIGSVFSPVSVVDLAVDQAIQQKEAFQQQINQAVEEAINQAVQAAKEKGASEDMQAKVAEETKLQVMQQIEAQYGSQMKQMEEMGEPSLTNEAFVKTVLFDENGNVQEMANDLLPQNGEHAVIVTKLAGNLSIDDMNQAVSDVEDIFKEKDINGLESLVSGTPKLTQAIQDSMTKDMAVMLGLSVVLMIIILLIVFPVKWRLLTLPVVLIGIVWTFGLMGYFGIPLSMVTMAILPILIGLGADFAIQFHNRYDEEFTKTGNAKESVITSIKHMGPAVGIAVVTMTAGFITLLVSKVPMIQDFGIMLSIGVFVIYTLELFLMFSILNIRDRKQKHSVNKQHSNKIEKALGWLSRKVVAYPLVVLLLAIGLSVGGFTFEDDLRVETDIEKLMPQDSPALIGLNEIRDTIGSTMEVSFMVEAEDVTKQEVLQWMENFEKNNLNKYDAFESSTSIASALKMMNDGQLPSNKDQMNQLIDSLPEAMKSSMITKDKKMASITFSVRNMPLQQQKELIEEIENDIQSPEGVEVTSTGMVVLAVKSISTLTDNRDFTTFLGIGAVFLSLLVLYRRIKLAVYPIVPIVLVIGWSSAMMYFLDVAINPLTAVLSALILGIGTEFTILLMERYQEERGKGIESQEAMITAMTKIGRAITASALTVTGGFSTLIFSDFVMLKAFGITTVLDTMFCLLSTLLVLPSIIILFEKRLGTKRTKNAQTE